VLKQRTWLGLGAFVLVVVAGLLIVGSEFQAVAQEERVIPIRAIRYEGGASSEAGVSCDFPPDTLGFPNANSQVVVTDQLGVIVAVEDIEGTLEESTVSAGALHCVAEFGVTVPDAAFYTVYLDDRRIKTIGADEFPIDSSEGVWIMFNSD
jgi:hypothetical protein